MADFVAEHHVGESFAPNDAADLAARVVSVLSRHDELTAPLAEGSALLREYSWDSAEEVLLRAYRSLPGSA
jgi:hypothetical protein